MKCSVLWKFNTVSPIIRHSKVKLLISYRQSMYANYTGKLKTKLNPKLLVLKYLPLIIQLSTHTAGQNSLILLIRHTYLYLVHDLFSTVRFCFP